MEVDKERIEKHLGEIAAEAIDIENILTKSDAEILKDQELAKKMGQAGRNISLTVSSRPQEAIG